MRKFTIYLVAIQMLFTPFIFGQLKVANNSNVGIQLGTSIPLSALSIGGVGDLNTKTFITNNTIGLKILRTGECGLMSRLGIDSYTDLNCSSPTWNL